jgi:hypothetical protein
LAEAAGIPERERDEADGGNFAKLDSKLRINFGSCSRFENRRASETIRFLRIEKWKSRPAERGLVFFGTLSPPFDPSVFAYQEKLNEQRRLKALKASARQMGYQLAPIAA